MKRCISIFFIILYLYNFAGYLVIFSVLRDRVKADVKHQLKETVPDSESVILAFHTHSLAHGVYPIQWMEEYEFRYAGEMFDVIRSFVVGDTTYVVCFNDVKENLLLADLDAHVNQHMGDSGSRASLDAFKDVFKDSFPHSLLPAILLAEIGMVISVRPSQYRSPNPDVPFHPPRSLPETGVL